MAGLIGGPGLFPGVNVGEGVAVFEQGARHVAKDIAGQGVANPSAGLLAAAMMLRHLNLPGFSDRCAPLLLCCVSSCARDSTHVLPRGDHINMYSYASFYIGFIWPSWAANRTAALERLAKLLLTYSC